MTLDSLVAPLRGYIKFAQDLPSGHIFQARIDGLTGYAELTTDPANISAAAAKPPHIL